MEPGVFDPKDRPPVRVRSGPTLASGAAGVTVAIILVLALATGVALFGATPLETSHSVAGAVAPSAGPTTRAAVPTPRIAPSSRPGPTAVAKAPTESSAPCHVTRPEPAFVPPGPYIPEGRFVATPPGYYESDWYGSARLWTMLDRDGEVWAPLVRQDAGLPQKTFWWSADWVPQDELEPAITVTGRRLDASGSFRFGDPGTNATADFGTAMLVGIDVPTYGCWRITARYRGASLSYVVSVPNPET
jgi:hypothetical protein